MKVPDSHIPQEMNWVDYCDSLRSDHYRLRAKSEKSFQAPEHIPDSAAVASSQQERVRELN